MLPVGIELLPTWNSMAVDEVTARSAPIAIQVNEKLSDEEQRNFPNQQSSMADPASGRFISHIRADCRAGQGAGDEGESALFHRVFYRLSFD